MLRMRHLASLARVMVEGYETYYTRGLRGLVQLEDEDEQYDQYIDFWFNEFRSFEEYKWQIQREREAGYFRPLFKDYQLDGTS
jgi:hypothetical protein